MIRTPHLTSACFSFCLAFAALSGACSSTEHVTLPANAQTPDGGAPTTEEPSPALPAHDAASFCKALCDREQQCDKSLDRQTCENACKNQNAAVFPKIRGDVIDLVVSCFAAKDCKQVLGGQVVSTCAAEALASVAPSTAATQYCDAYAKAKQTCGNPSAKAECLATAKLYTDDAIAQASNCTKRPCAEIDTCVAAAFGSFGAGAAPTSCAGQFSDLGACTSCAEGACCAEASACAADATCRQLLRYCMANGSASSQCAQYLQSASTSTRQLLSAAYTCAQSRCSASCSP